MEPRNDEYAIGRSDAGRRVDAWLARRFDCSRARARELLAIGAVRVDGRPLRSGDKGRKLVAGEIVAIEAAPADADVLRPRADRALEVIERGAGWIAVAKPAGLPVHPLRADETDSVLHRLLAREPAVMGVGEGGRRSGVVHRLDVDTSGIQVFALDHDGWRRWRAAFTEHRIDKVYRALVAGVPATHGRLELDLAVVRHRPARVGAAPAGEGPDDARRCVTHWRRLEAFDDAALVEARPRSGFLHQIRVSFEHVGHPLLGDAIYGTDVAARAPRHMLHASALRLGSIDLECPDPNDFATTLTALRARR